MKKRKKLGWIERMKDELNEGKEAARVDRKNKGYAKGSKDRRMEERKDGMKKKQKKGRAKKKERKKGGNMKKSEEE